MAGGVGDGSRLLIPVALLILRDLRLPEPANMSRVMTKKGGINPSPCLLGRAQLSPTSDDVMTTSSPSSLTCRHEDGRLSTSG